LRRRQRRAGGAGGARERDADDLPGGVGHPAAYRVRRLPRARHRERRTQRPRPGHPDFRRAGFSRRDRGGSLPSGPSRASRRRRAGRPTSPPKTRSGATGSGRAISACSDRRRPWACASTTSSR
jgi:hypothetical protein